MTPIEFALKEWPLVAVAVVSGTMLVWPLVARRMSPMKEVGTHAATQLINRDALVLDVREQKELEADRGKLPHAVHIPLSELDKRIGEIAARAGKPVVAYCARGQRSRGAGRRAREGGLQGRLHAARRPRRVARRGAAAGVLTWPPSRCTRPACARTASRRSGS
jgi:rhodanese-related sulfurtransferase